MATVLTASGWGGGSPAAAQERFRWQRLPPLPAARGESKQLGVAGPFLGVSGDALLLLGGANFPQGMPWELRDNQAPPKIYHEHIFALSGPLQAADPAAGLDWQQAPDRWQPPAAYGGAVETAQGLVCVGGEWKERQRAPDGSEVWTTRLSARVIVAQWLPAEGRVALSRRWRDAALPSLPRPLTACSAARIGETLYVLGGDAGQGATRTFWKLDLAQRHRADFAWKPLPPWPGPPRVLPVVVAAGPQGEEALYLISGRNPQPGRATQLLSDVYRYRPLTEVWQKLPDVTVAGQPRCVMAGTGVPLGAEHLLVIGGADGKLFQRLETLGQQIAEAAEARQQPQRESLRQRQRELLENHPGFSRELLLMNLSSGQWSVAGSFPAACPVTTRATWWRGGIVVASGEIRPGVRQRDVWFGTLAD